MDLPIYIASKARPSGGTFALLDAADLRATVLVEPQDAAAYAQLPHDLHVLPANDRGLAYVRQAALELARAAALEWFWMLDDDLVSFYEAGGGRCRPVGAEVALGRAPRLFRAHPQLGQAALEYQQFAWSTRDGYVLDSYCDVAVAIHTAVPVNFRPEFELKVDRDFTLQVLAAGWHTMRVQRYAFACPGNGSNAGGLQPIYAAGTEAAEVQRLAAAWPGAVAPQTKRNGRPDAKVHWKRARGAAL